MDNKVLQIFEYDKKMENKMANLKKNHRRLSMRCLGTDIIPVSIRLKGCIRTPRSVNIFKKAERALLNERIGTINSLELFEYQRGTCINKLS